MADRGPHPLIELTRARMLEFIREPAALFWTFVFPVLLAAALGVAFKNRPPEQAVVAVTGPAAAKIVVALEADGAAKAEILDDTDALERLRKGRVDLIVRTSAETPDGVVYRFDPMRPNAVPARLAVDAAVQRSLGRVDVLEVRDEEVTEQGGRYIDWLLPSLLGMNIMSSCLWGMAYAIVDSRKRKLLKRFAATPMNRGHYLLSYLLSRLAFLVVEVVALLTVGWVIFDVTVYGSFAAVAVLTLFGSAAFTGLALLVSARPESSEVASGWINFAMMPMYMLSGAFFDYQRFPELAHPFIRGLPLTALNDALRLVINDGAGLLACGSELLVMTAWAIGGFLLALRMFRWQ